MALINCVECGGVVSTEAAACPHCGTPVREKSLHTSNKREDGKALIKTHIETQNSHAITSGLRSLIGCMAKIGMLVGILFVIGVIIRFVQFGFFTPPAGPSYDFARNAISKAWNIEVIGVDTNQPAQRRKPGFPPDAWVYTIPYQFHLSENVGALTLDNGDAYFYRDPQGRWMIRGDDKHLFPERLSPIQVDPESHTEDAKIHSFLNNNQ